VNVYRDGTNGSATLPVYFAPLFGVTSQAVNATATAQVFAATQQIVYALGWSPTCGTS